MSPNYLNDLLECIGNRDLSINVISKSGTTNPSQLLHLEFLENFWNLNMELTRQDVEYMLQQIKKEELLKLFSNEEEYETFVIPDNIGGRYSVLTAVGLLPIAVAGIDIDKLMSGAKKQKTSIMKVH